MNEPSPQDQSWFAAGGKSYAEFRPHYPKALSAWLAQESPSRVLAADIGCGTGQLTYDLKDNFDHVIGIDPSADQIAHTRPHPAIRFEVGHAEALPFADHSCDLIAAAQAAHWFDLAKFYECATRALKPEGLLALVSYGVPQLDAPCRDRFKAFYYEDIGPYWPKERRHVDEGYRRLHFPFFEITAPKFDILLSWTVQDFLGYVGTWSATKAAVKAGKAEVLAEFGKDLTALWGSDSTPRPVIWPISIRAGRKTP